MCEIALVARPTDSCTRFLMEDSRVCAVLDGIKDTLAEEMEYVSELDEFCFQKLAEVCCLPVGDCKHSVIRRALVSVGFIYFRIVKVAESRPWRLCIGDVNENLAALPCEDEPGDDEVTNQIWHCLQNGWPPRSDILDAVRDWRELLWDTALTESQHANAASVMRHHPDYGLETCRATSSVLMANKLLPRPTRDEKATNALRAKVSKLKKAQSQKASLGKHAFVKTVFDGVARARKLGNRAPKKFQQGVIRKHGPLWENTSLENKLK